MSLQLLVDSCITAYFLLAISLLKQLYHEQGSFALLIGHQEVAILFLTPPKREIAVSALRFDFIMAYSYRESRDKLVALLRPLLWAQKLHSQATLCKAMQGGDERDFDF